MALRVVPISFAEAVAFVGEHHRHLSPPTGWKFGAGVVDDRAILVGVVMAGRPVNVRQDDGVTLEVNRLCTTGERNAASALLGAINRAARALGYARVITYTIEGESGASLKGAGWTVIGEGTGRPATSRSWTRAGNPGRGMDVIRRLWLAPGSRPWPEGVAAIRGALTRKEGGRMTRPMR